MLRNKAELVFDCRNIIGEGPIWDVDQHTLYWIDIIGKKIMSWDSEDTYYNSFDIPQMVGCVAVCENNLLLLTLQNGIYFFNKHNNKLIKINDTESALELNRFNDGKCDPAGRFWAGTMEITPQSPNGSLYMLNHDLSIKKKIENITISNGITWSLDNKKMYYIDTPTNEIRIYNYNNDTADIEFDSVLLKVDGNTGCLDGMTIDENGNLWVAMYGGSSVNCFDKNSGKILKMIDLPTSNVTSCTFGGKDLDTLYITTAINGLSEEQLKNETLAGGLFKIKLDVKGVPSFRFKTDEYSDRIL